jgi:hypothetical protein
MNGRSVLTVDGRSIIGTHETIKLLQSNMGGEIEKSLPNITKKKISSKVKPLPIVKTKTDTIAVTDSRQKIYDTFTECLKRI